MGRDTKRKGKTRKRQEWAARVGASLLRARRGAGLTQADAAAAIGVTQASVSYWERGMCVPDMSRVRKVAAVYGVDFETLVPKAAA